MSWCIVKAIMQNKSKKIYTLNVVKMKITSLEDYQFLERFPFLEDLAISNAPSAPVLKFILTRSFNRLELHRIKVTLNVILISNSSVFSIQHHLISDEDINIFMKHWIKGSHPHLQELQIIFRRVSQNHLVESVFLKGIDYIETMGHGSRVWRKFAIKSRDGTNAIVTINSGNHIYFGLIVA